MAANSNKEFDDSIKITKITSFISGYELGESKYYYLKWYYYFNIMWLYSDVFAEFVWFVDGIKMGKSLVEVSMAGPCFLICFLGTAKTLPLFLNREITKMVVDKLKAIHSDYANCDEEADSDGMSAERVIAVESIKFLKTFILLHLVIGGIVLVGFSCEPIMVLAYHYYYTGEVKLILSFQMKYFFDAFANNTIWSFVYFHQVWSSTIVCVGIFAVDSLFYVFCMYLRMHFRILRHHFENMVCDSRETTRQNLRNGIRRHQELVELVDQLEILYSKSTLFNMLSSSILICLSGFTITVDHNTSTVLTFGPFLTLNLAEVFLMCFFGDLLMASSTEISEGVYNCRWYEANPEVRSSIIIILVKSQKPCKVTAANFTDLNLRAFTMILGRSWSYFALLKTMYD